MFHSGTSGPGVATGVEDGQTSVRSLTSSKAPGVLLGRTSMGPKIMADEEEVVPPIPKLGASYCVLCGYIGCKCFGACCLASLCLLVAAASISFIYTFGKSECDRPGDFPRALCNPVTSPCNAETGWECRLLGGCVYGPAVGKMSTNQLSLFYRAESRICW